MQDFLFLNKEYITILHVLSVVIGMGGALVTDIVFVYFAINKKLSFYEIKTIKLLSQIVLYSLFAIIATGLLIFMSDINKYINSVKFITKMTVVFVLTINGLLLHKMVFKHLKDNNYLTNFKNTKSRRIAFILGSVSFISWLSAMSLGVLDKINLTYIQALSVYFIILLIGILFSQIFFQIYEKISIKKQN